MSIEGKHAYRFLYLKSSKWQDVRIEALAREKGKCQICGEESISNDAHHVWYPESVWDTTEKNLVILCRSCHDFVHAMLPECKTNDEDVGRSSWAKFRNSIIAWRQDKIFLFSENESNPSLLPPSPKDDSVKLVKAAELREAYEKVKLYSRKLERALREYIGQFGELPVLLSLRDEIPLKVEKPHRKDKPVSLKHQTNSIIETIRKWADVYCDSVYHEKTEVADSDFQI